jgi:putative membrane protein
MSRAWVFGLLVAGLAFAPAAQAGHHDDPAKGEEKAEKAGGEAKQESGEARSGATQAGTDVRTSAEQDPAEKSAPATGRATTESGKAEQLGGARPESTEIIKKLYSRSALDAETAKLAKQKATDERVKEFADEIARDHQRLGERLEEVAKGRNVELSRGTALSGAQQEHVQAMKEMSTSQFEAHFWEMMSQDHGKLLKDLDAGIEQADRTGDRQLAAVLQDARPTIAGHHATATGAGQGGASMGTGSAGSAGSAGETPPGTGSTGKPSQPEEAQPSGQRP